MKTEETKTAEEIKAAQAAVRSAARDMAVAIGVHCPTGREKSLALTNLQQTVMWAQTAISPNE